MVMYGLADGAHGAVGGVKSFKHSYFGQIVA